jgi:ABC-2 type transport system permease protein
MLNNLQFKHKITRIKALIKKESYQIIRDSSSIIIAFIYPMILLTIYGIGVSLDIDHLKVGVVLEDTNPDANNFYLSIKDSKYFSAEVARNQKNLESKLIAGKLKGLVIVPFYFSQYSERPDRKGPIYVVADGSDPNTANFVQNYVEGSWAKSVTQLAINTGNQYLPAIDVQPRFWFNETLNSRHFLIPGSIALIMTLIGSLLTALVIAREWERGTIEALMATPVTIREIYLSKTISYFILGMASMVICTIISTIFFGVPFRGSLLVLVVVSSVFLLTALGTGLLISSLCKNQFLSSQLSLTISFLPAFMLSGFIFEISSMPILIRALTYLLPARYMVTCLEALFLVGNVWRLLFINVGTMSLIVIILFLLIFSKPKKRLD